MRTIMIIVLFAPIISIAQNPIHKEGWKLTFNDEFNDGKLDYAKWKDHSYWGGRSHDRSDTYYGKSQIKFTDSTMLLVAEKKSNELNIINTYL